MLQPPNRRKIMLAPSFLQNLTPIKDAKPLVPSDSNKLNGSASESEKNDESQNKEGNAVAGIPTSWSCDFNQRIA